MATRVGTRRHTRWSVAVFVTALLVTNLPSLRAHHAASALYDSSRTIDVVGVITRVVLKNPHSFVYVAEARGAGRATEWQIEMGPTTQLARAGWTTERLKPGLKIRVSGQPSRAEGSHAICCTRIVRFDGSPINPNRPSSAAP